MSSKNALQEIFQKRGQKLPQYFSRQIGGLDHEPVWLTEVKLPSGERVTGRPSKSKGEAEKSAASVAIEKITPNAQKRVCLLIDGETMTQLVKVVEDNPCPRIDTMLFVGRHHLLSELEYTPNIKKILVPTNGVDTCMQIYVGTFLQQEKYDLYLIGADPNWTALVDLIQAKDHPWTAKTARLVTSESQLRYYLE